MKAHKLEHVRTTLQSTDWHKLQGLIAGEKRISVSGGGDPLFQLDANMGWWNKFFEIVQKTGVVVDLHTAKLAPVDFGKKFAKYVWHVKDITKPIASEYKQLIDYGIPVRMTVVAEAKYTEHDYLIFAKQVVMMGFQCSFRELVTREGTFPYNQDILKFLESEQGWKFVRQADYNYYFMPDNTVTDKFIYSYPW